MRGTRRATSMECCTPLVGVLLCTESSSGCDDLFLTVKTAKEVNAQIDKLQYAGSREDGMYFRAKKSEQKYSLIRVDPREKIVDVIGESPHSSVTFFHRQPYYLSKLGIISPSWYIRPFNAADEWWRIDLSGVSIGTESLLVYKNNTVFIFQCGSINKRKIHGSYAIVQHPLLNSKCTAFTSPDSPYIYISSSFAPRLMKLNIKTLSLKLFELPKILDIRNAHYGVLEFAEVTQDGTKMHVTHIEDERSRRLCSRYIKDRLGPPIEVQLKEAIEHPILASGQLDETTRSAAEASYHEEPVEPDLALLSLDLIEKFDVLKLENRQLLATHSAKDEEISALKEKQKVLGQDLFAANQTINQLRKESKETKASLALNGEIGRLQQKTVNQKQTISQLEKQVASMQTTIDSEKQKSGNAYNQSTQQIRELEEQVSWVQQDLDSELKKNAQQASNHAQQINQMKVRLTTQQQELEKEKSKSVQRGNENQQIFQLKKQLAAAHKDLEKERQKSEKNLTRANKEQQNAALKEKEHRLELAKMRQDCATVAQSNVSISELAQIRDQRDLLTVQNAELDRKYRRMLLLFGRNKQPVPSHVDTTALNTSQTLVGTDPVSEKTIGMAPITTTLSKKKNKKKAAHVSQIPAMDEKDLITF